MIDIIYVASGITDLEIYKEMVKAMKQNINYPAKVAAGKLLLEATGRLKERIEISISNKIDYSVYTPDQLLQLENLLSIGSGNKPEPLQIEGRTITDLDGDQGRDVQTEPI